MTTIGTHRPTQLVIDQAAIYHNIATEKARLAKGTDLFMVVKANGYGHGITQVATTAVKAGATGFCVAILDEALTLRAAGFNQPILVLGITEPQYAGLMAQKHISATVGSQDWLEAATTSIETVSPDQPLNVHLGLDTGMGRIGFQEPEALAAAVTALTASPAFNFEGIFTHFQRPIQRIRRTLKNKLVAGKPLWQSCQSDHGTFTCRTQQLVCGMMLATAI